MTKIIFDTNIYFSAIGWDGKILDLVIHCFKKDEIDIFSSQDISEEIHEKLKSQKFQKLVKGKIEESFIIEILDLITQNSQTEAVTTKLNICRDPKDNKFLELAQTVKADYLITGDRDLLDLKEFEETKILKPSEFILELGLRV
jgi:putative PIN family toxin of toxin-antitoxin system